MAAKLSYESTTRVLSRSCLAWSVACFSAMQSTLVLLCAPPEVRGRMMGVLTVCIGSGPVGFFHLGLLADRFGASTAVAIMTVEGLVMIAIALRVWPELVGRQSMPES